MSAMVLAICYPPHFMAEGFSAAEAGWFLSFAGICGLVGKTVMAGAGEAFKHHAKWLVAGLLLMQGVGLLVLLNVESSTGVLVGLAFAKSSNNTFLPIHTYINNHYYPPKIINQITETQIPLFLPFSLIRPPLTSYVFNQTNSYQ